MKDLAYNISLWSSLATVVILCIHEFIITYVKCLFHQLVNKHITFQSYLETNNMKNYVILREQVTLTKIVRAFYNPLYVSRSLSVRIWFNDCSS